MYTPASDEKTTLVMVYTHSAMMRGEVVTKEGSRVSTWLRTPAAPRYLHLLKVNAIRFEGGATRSENHSEFFVPVTQVIAFHLAPPASDPMDYEEGEKNRMMQPLTVAVGTFVFKGEMRISSQSNLGANLELSKIAWLSLYNLEIGNPQLPQMPPLHVPMAIVSPEQVLYGL
jgi:hypothetical protein